MSTEGEIKGRLSLDSAQFRAEIAAAKAQLDELTSKRTDINVGANTRPARTELDATTKSAAALTAAEGRLQAALRDVDRAVAAAAAVQGRLDKSQNDLAASALRATTAEDALKSALEREAAAAARAAAANTGLDASQKKSTASVKELSRSADSGAGRIAVIAAAIVSLTPALFPIAGVATAGAAALTGMGAAGLLAGTGIARGFKDGSGAASQYRPLINQVLDDVHRLQDTAAMGLLPGAESTLTALQAKLPSITAGVGEMAADLGNMLPTGLDAVVALTERGVPLWRSGADWLGRMVQGIDDFAHSDAYKGFIDYSVRNGPKVEQFLLHVLQLVGDIITAWAPYGEAVLPVLDDTVQVIGKIIKELGPLVPAIAAVYLAFRAWAGIRTIIDGIATGLELMGVKATAAGAAAESAGAATKAGAGLAAAGWATALIAATQYADYLAAQQNYANAQKLTKGSASRKSEVAGMAARASMTGPQTAGGGAMDAGLGAQINASLAKKESGAQIELAASTARAVAASRLMVASQRDMRTALNAASTAAQNAAAGQEKLATDTQSIAGAQMSAKDAIVAAGAALKDNGKTLSGNTDKARANRETVLAAVSSISAYGQQLIKSGSSALQARVAEEKLGVELENTLVKMGMGRSEAGRYIAKLLGIPKNVSTLAQLKKDQAEAALEKYRREVAALNGYVATVYVSLRQTGLSPGQAAQVAKNQGVRTNAVGGTVGADDLKHALKSIPAHAAGATVRGPGTSSSDSVLRWLSAGEEVTSNLRGQASANRPMLKAINTGDRAQIARTAAEQYGTAQQVQVTAHFTDDGSYVGGIARQAAEQAVAAYDRAALRTAKRGWMNKGALVGNGS